MPRKAWKVPGFVVSAAFSIRDLVTHGFARERGDAAYRALGVNGHGGRHLPGESRRAV